MENGGWKMEKRATSCDDGPLGTVVRISYFSSFMTNFAFKKKDPDHF
jgi:hypothetical protein